MLQIETIENFAGFADKNQPGEYYHSENMIPGQFGLEANIKITEDAIAIGSTPSRFNWFTEYSSFPYAVDILGNIFSRTSNQWTSARTVSGSSGNGLITDQKGRLLYARNQYLGMYDGAWTDGWKDMTTNSAELRPMDLYEDWVVIGNVSNVAVLNTTDDSFSYNSLTLPSGSIVKAIKTNQTGVLIGVNLGNRSFILLWDVRSPRSISEWIWFDHQIQSICKFGSRWIVTTQKQQVITDGYSLSPLPAMPDAFEQSEIYHCIPAGTMVVGEKLFTANTDISASYNRLRSGLWIQDLNNGMFTFVPVANGCTEDMTMGALFHDSSFNNFISYSTNTPAGNFPAKIENAAPSSAVFISPMVGQGPNNKVAEGVKLELINVAKTKSVFPTGSFTVAAKIYNYKRPLWGYGSTNGLSASTNQLNVDGTVGGRNNAKIGDEVTILSGVNAGQVRHITAISGQDTSNEVWTLNSALPNNTENGVAFNVQPFQLIKSKAVSFSNYDELKDYYFDIKNRIKGKKYLIKIVVTGITNVSLAVPSLTFIYDDLGVI